MGYATFKLPGLLIVLIMVSIVPAFAAQVVWESLNQAGQAAFEKGHYPEAEQLFLQSLQKANSSQVKKARIAAILTNLGAACREEGKYTAAEYIFKRALSVSKDMDPLSKAVLLRHYGALLSQMKNGADSKLVLKDVPYIEKQLNTDQKLIPGTANSQVIVDGVRSGFIEQGKFISAAELFTAVQLYRSAGLFLPAEELESRARQIFGASYPSVWAALASEAQDEALKNTAMQNEEQESRLRVERALAVEQEAKARAKQAQADEAQARLEAQQNLSAQNQGQSRDITPASGDSMYQIMSSGDMVVPAPVTIVPYYANPTVFSPSGGASAGRGSQSQAWSSGGAYGSFRYPSSTWGLH